MSLGRRERRREERRKSARNEGQGERAANLGRGVGHRSNDDGGLRDHSLDLVNLESSADGDEKLSFERFSGNLGEEGGHQLRFAAKRKAKRKRVSASP